MIKRPAHLLFIAVNLRAIEMAVSDLGGSDHSLGHLLVADMIRAESSHADDGDRPLRHVASWNGKDRFGSHKKYCIALIQSGEWSGLTL